jgi:hypothetical protein
MFDPALLTPHMSLFEQPQAKELLVSPAGVRVVYQLAQGERAYYAVFRSLRFANLPVADGMTRWISSGATHHTAICSGRHGDALRIIANYLGIDTEIF